MNCKKCKSDCNKAGTKDGKQWYKCKNEDCKYEFWEGSVIRNSSAKVGMSLGEFKAKYDTEFIVKERLGKAMSGLSRNLIYEKADIVKLAGLPASYPGFKDTLDSYDDHQGRTSSKTFYAHPDTIKELKELAKLM